MSDEFGGMSEVTPERTAAPWKMYVTHLLLLVLTFLTTTISGVAWMNNDPLELRNFPMGMTYSLLLLLMLASHEFGHYIAARIHKVRTTLPFFLPWPIFLPFGIFGTLGAVIRLRSSIPSRKVLFDIGAAGPIAGFVVSLVILVIGFVTLPPKEYLYMIHPEYAQMQVVPEGGISFGVTALFSLLAEILAPAGAFVPPMNEVYHYPFLCVGWFGLFVTSMNLIPIGQLDGGHISYAMFGNRYHVIGQAALVVLMVLGFAGLLPYVGIDVRFGSITWLVFGILIMVIIKLMKVGRPPVVDETPIDPMRKAIGWFCYAILIASFSTTPFAVSSADVLF